MARSYPCLTLLREDREAVVEPQMSKLNLLMLVELEQDDHLLRGGEIESMGTSHSEPFSFSLSIGPVDV